MEKEKLCSLIAECTLTVLLNDGYTYDRATNAVNASFHEIVSIVEKRCDYNDIY